MIKKTTHILLVGSCNGLVYYECSGGICISNPITGERIRVPDKGEYFVTYRLGFGYCHLTDAYKVVRIREVDPYKQDVQVYTLGDGRGWRDIQDITYWFQESGVFINGALHLLSRGHGDIVAFDLTSEAFRSLPSPCHIPYHSYKHTNLGSLGGDLYLWHSNMEQSEPMTDIWVFRNKNLNNCRDSTRLQEQTYLNSFTWIKVISRIWGAPLTQERKLLIPNRE